MINMFTGRVYRALHEEEGIDDSVLHHVDSQGGCPNIDRQAFGCFGKAIPRVSASSTYQCNTCIGRHPEYLVQLSSFEQTSLRQDRATKPRAMTKISNNQPDNSAA